MNGQVQFGGNVPFTDQNTGQPVQVRVWGVYVGQGVDAHEEDAIQQWIMNALATSAASYQGNVHELPSKAQEWGAWVSQQIAPGLAQAFQAQGQLQIQGVAIEGQGAPAKQAPPMAAVGGGGQADVAAAALMNQLGISHQDAMQAANIVLQSLGLAGAGAPQGGYAKAGYKQAGYKQPDAYAKKGAPVGKQPDAYAKKGAPVGKQADPYGKQSYGKQADPYSKQPDAYAKKGAPAGKQADPYGKQSHGKQAPQKSAPYKQPAQSPKHAPAKSAPAKGHDPWKK